MKRRFKIRPEYMGLTISVKTLSGGTLSMSTKEATEEDLALYFRIEEFTPYIEEIWETPVQTPASPSTEGCPVCSNAPCECTSEVTKPVKTRKRK